MINLNPTNIVFIELSIVGAWNQYGGPSYQTMLDGDDFTSQGCGAEGLCARYELTDIQAGYYQVTATVHTTDGQTEYFYRDNTYGWDNLVEIDLLNPDNHGNRTDIDFYIGFVDLTKGFIQGYLDFGDTDAPYLDRIVIDNADQSVNDNAFKQSILTRSAEDPHGLVLFQVYNLPLRRFEPVGWLNSEQGCRSTLRAVCDSVDCPNGAVELTVKDPGVGLLPLRFAFGSGTVSGNVTLGPQMVGKHVQVLLYDGAPYLKTSRVTAGKQFDGQAGLNNWCLGEIGAGTYYVVTTAETNPGAFTWDLPTGGSITVAASGTVDGLDLYLGTPKPGGSSISGELHVPIYRTFNSLKVIARLGDLKERSTMVRTAEAVPAGIFADYQKYSFTFSDLPPETYRLSATASYDEGGRTIELTGYDPASPQVLDAGISVTGVVINVGLPDAALGSISGVVTLPVGHENDMVMVGVWFADDLPAGWEKGVIPSVSPMAISAATPQGGAAVYELTSLPPGDYVVLAGVINPACGASQYPTAVKYYGSPPTSVSIPAGGSAMADVNFAFITQDLYCDGVKCLTDSDCNIGVTANLVCSQGQCVNKGTIQGVIEAEFDGIIFSKVQAIVASLDDSGELNTKIVSDVNATFQAVENGKQLWNYSVPGLPPGYYGVYATMSNTLDGSNDYAYPMTKKVVVGDEIQNVDLMNHGLTGCPTCITGSVYSPVLKTSKTFNKPIVKVWRKNDPPPHPNYDAFSSTVAPDRYKPIQTSRIIKSEFIKNGGVLKSKVTYEVPIDAAPSYAEYFLTAHLFDMFYCSRQLGAQAPGNRAVVEPAARAH